VPEFQQRSLSPSLAPPQRVSDFLFHRGRRRASSPPNCALYFLTSPSFQAVADAGSLSWTGQSKFPLSLLGVVFVSRPASPMDCELPVAFAHSHVRITVQRAASSPLAQPSALLFPVAAKGRTDSSRAVRRVGFFTIARRCSFPQSDMVLWVADPRGSPSHPYSRAMLWDGLSGSSSVFSAAFFFPAPKFLGRSQLV